jgi:hypothetical protein
LGVKVCDQVPKQCPASERLESIGTKPIQGGLTDVQKTITSLFLLQAIVFKPLNSEWLLKNFQNF